MKKIIFNSTVFIVLCFVGLFFAVLCYQESYITTLFHYHDNHVYSSYSAGPIIPGGIIHGEISAAYDNFAAVKLRFNTFNRMNTSHIVFRMKEKGSNEWYIVNTYVLDRFEDGLLYPFGFPPIQSSKGKTYDFEVFSTDGINDNAIGIMSGYHSVATQYVFSKLVLMHNKQLLAGFVKQKLLGIVGDPFSILYFGIFILPALAWLVRGSNRKEKTSQYILAILCGYLFLVYTYLPVDMNTNTVVFVAAAGLFVGYILSASAARAYQVALLSAVQICLSLLLGNTLAANRLATLIFFLMIAGGIMSFKEDKRIIK